MFAKKRHELDDLENQFRGALKTYRGLMRWGIDKVLQDSVAVIQDSFSTTRKLLDEKQSAQAGNVLTELLSQLQVMEQSYREKKAILVDDIASSIRFLESLISDQSIQPIYLDGQQVTADSLKQTLEKARHALQNDDWQQGKTILNQVMNRHVAIRQTQLQDYHSLGLTGEVRSDVTQSLDMLLKKKMTCRKSSQDRFTKLRQLAATQNVTTKSIAALGSAVEITRLFSALSKQSLSVETVMPELCLLLRVTISRDYTMYLVGVPIDQPCDVFQLRNFLQNFTAAFVHLDSVAITAAQGDKIMLACLDQLPSDQITVAGQNALSLLCESQLSVCDLFKQRIVDEMSEQTFVSWAANKA